MYWEERRRAECSVFLLPDDTSSEAYPVLYHTSTASRPINTSPRNSSSSSRPVLHRALSYENRCYSVCTPSRGHRKVVEVNNWVDGELPPADFSSTNQRGGGTTWSTSARCSTFSSQSRDDHDDHDCRQGEKISAPLVFDTRVPSAKARAQSGKGYMWLYLFNDGYRIGVPIL